LVFPKACSGSGGSSDDSSDLEANNDSSEEVPGEVLSAAAELERLSDDSSAEVVDDTSSNVDEVLIDVSKSLDMVAEPEKIAVAEKSESQGVAKSSSSENSPSSRSPAKAPSIVPQELNASGRWVKGFWNNGTWVPGKWSMPGVWAQGDDVYPDDDGNSDLLENTPQRWQALFIDEFTDTDEKVVAITNVVIQLDATPGSVIKELLVETLASAAGGCCLGTVVIAKTHGGDVAPYETGNGADG